MEPSPYLHRTLLKPLPILNKPRRAHQQTSFVLDCTDPFQSRLQKNVPHEDSNTQPSLSVLNSKMQRNCSPSSPDFKIRKKIAQSVSSVDFKKFLSWKINALKQNSIKTIDQNENEQKKADETKKSNKFKDKQVKFLENKYRCFMQPKVNNKKLQNT